MAAVSSNLHRLNHPPPATTRQQAQPEPPVEEFHHQPIPFILDFESFSPSYNSSSPYFFDDYSTSLEFGFDVNENRGFEYEDTNCIYGGEEDDEQMNFVTDVFESSCATEDPIWELGADSALEFGLPVARTNSESDAEEIEVNSRLCDNNNNNVQNDDICEISNRNNCHWNEMEELEWEEVNERAHFDGMENLNSVINRIEELSVSLISDISSSQGEDRMLDDDDDDEVGEEERNIEWEVLLAVNNLERTFELDDLEEDDENGSEVPRDGLLEDYILSMEYDALFGQLVENENALKGSPPAAKSVVENLPTVVLRKEEVRDDNCVAVCAICKDELAFGEKVTRMPCCHLYHRDCILPWLKIRNTCPVCRYELPTDDADYEKKRSETDRSRLSAVLVNDLEGRYNFELLP